jgi:hypothetical protein
MSQLEVHGVATIINPTFEIVVIQLIIFNPYRSIFFYEIYLNPTVGYSPLDMVGNIVAAPSIAAIVVNPIART